MKSAFQLPVIVILTLVWVLLWGQFTPFIVLSGVVVAVVVLAAFPQPPIKQHIRLRPLAFVRLAARFVFDLVVASAQIAAQALHFGYEPTGAVIEVRLRSRSDLFLTLTAELLSLVPGSLLIETSGTRSVLFLHIFGVRDSEEAEHARVRALDQERRVVEALATDEDLAAYRERVREEQPR